MADEKLSDEQIVTLMLWHPANHPLAIALRQLRAELAEARAAVRAADEKVASNAHYHFLTWRQTHAAAIARAQEDRG